MSIFLAAPLAVASLYRTPRRQPLRPFGQRRRLQPARHLLERRPRASPAQRLDGVEEALASTQRCQVAEEIGALAFQVKRPAELADPADIHVPGGALRRKLLEADPAHRTAAVERAPHPGRP